MNEGAADRGPLRVAIVGAGPAGSALAILLARQGGEVTLFDDGRRPELLVGESLVPAVVPILRRLGVEEETATFSCVKPGVSFIWSPTDRVSITFDRFAPAVFPYAYNIPRPRFDEALLASAIASGVRHVPVRARLQAVPRASARAELALAPETLAAAPALEGRPPHLIVDATGRARHVARALAIPARLGPRKDVAHFAHFEGFEWDEAPGQVLIARGRGGLELVHPAPGAALDRHRAGPGRRGPPRAHSGSAARARHRDRRLALFYRRRRKAGDGRGDLLQLPADLRARLRPRLGHGGRRLRLHRPDALARGLPRAPLGRATRRRPDPVARTTARSRRRPSWSRRWPRTPTARTRCCRPGSSWWPISTMGG